MKVLAIIPAYNEAVNLPKVIDELAGFDYIIINDGSTDNTKQLPYNMINLKRNHGVGYAMQVGYKYAYKNGYDYAVQIDGDCQHNPKYIPLFVKAMENADMVIGSRCVDKECGFFRRIGIKQIQRLIKRSTFNDITDPTSGMRMVNRKVMRDFIKDYPKIAAEPISIINAIKDGRVVKEIPVKMRKRAGGKSFVNVKSVTNYMLAIFRHTL